MYFCEICNLISETNICNNCNKKNLRAVNEEDFCFFLDLPVFSAKMLETMLENNQIEFIFLPIRNSISRGALSKEADTHRIFIKYKYYEISKKLYNEFFN